MTRRNRLIVAVFAALALAAIAAGCGSSGGEGGSHPDYTKLENAPEPLGKLYGEGDKLLPGGTEAFEKRLAELKGHPVVVNVWASWCGPCRYEFPTLQKLSAKYGTKVAFLGVNSEDSEANAAEFLEEDPVPYPSFSDPNQDLKRHLGADSGFPDTAFFNSAGKLVYLKIGQYASPADLEADVEKYALGSA
jgi:cytochrome c biogenesis protein CcmG/thiol:disulfide interchange protein DsbE